MIETRNTLTIGLVAAMLGALGCSDKNSIVDPGPLTAAGITVAISPNPLVQSGTGACVNAFGPTPPGAFRLFPLAVTIQETQGVGLTINSYVVTAISGGVEFPVVDLASSMVAERLSGCGGTSNRLDARGRRCTPVSPFCSPVTSRVPDQIRVSFTGVDDNGFAIAGNHVVPLITTVPVSASQGVSDQQAGEALHYE